MKIIKAKITKDSTLVATYKDENGTTTVEGKNLVTSDLINAFSKLNPHAALLTEQKEVDGIESVDEVPDIIGQVLDVTGYSIGGDGDNEVCTGFWNGVRLYVCVRRVFLKRKFLLYNSPFFVEQILFDFELTGLDFLLQLEGIDIRFILIIEHGERSA